MVDFKQHPLLEQSLPDLCADRVDYFLRDGVMDGLLTTEQALSYLDDLKVIDHQALAFETQDVAREFADGFREMNSRRWAAPIDMALYTVLAEAMRLAMEAKMITLDDLFGTDDDVWNKLEKSGNAEVVRKLQLVKTMNVKVVEDGEDYDYKVKSKIRLVDPWVVSGDGLERLSELDGEFAVANAEYMNEHQEGCLVKLA